MTDFLSQVNFDGLTIGSFPSGWTASGTSGKWTVETAPTGMSGRALRGVRSATDAYATRTITRQTSGTIYTRFKVRVGSTNTASDWWGFCGLYDGGSYLQYVQVSGSGNLQVLNSTASGYVTVATLSASTVYTIEVAYSISAKKITSIKVDSTTYTNGGAGWPSGTTATGFDSITFDCYSGVITGSEYVWFDEVSITDYAYPSAAPTTGTLAISGTLGGQTLGTNIYGMAVMGYTEGGGGAPSSFTVERSNDGGSTWADISANCSWAVISGTNWKVIDRRPQYGGQATTWGGSPKYRVTPTNALGSGSVSSTVTASTLQPSRTGVISQRAASLSAYMGGSAIASQPGAYYPADTVLEMALGYFNSVQLGSPVAQYATDAMTQFAYLQTLANADHLLLYPTITDYFYTDFHWRSLYYSLIASNLLRLAGSTSNANTILAQVDQWAKAFFDSVKGGNPFGSRTITGWNHASQTQRANSTAYAVGDIVRLVSDNNHTYRCITAGTSASSVPTFSTSEGATVTDGTVTWKETGYTGYTLQITYARTSPYGDGISGLYFSPNQMIEIAAALSLLLTTTGSAFNTAGSYRTIGLAAVPDLVGLATAMQNSSGSIPQNETDATYNDTLYGGFVAQSAAVIWKRLGSQTAAHVAWMTRLTNWLLGVYSTSEPINTGVIHSASWDPDVGSGPDPDGPFELLFPYNAALLLGLSTGNLENIALSGAFWDESTNRWGDYNATGLIDHIDSVPSHAPGPYPALSQNTLDSYAVYYGVEQLDFPGRGGATADGRAPTDAAADQAGRGAATADAYAPVDVASTIEASGRGAATADGRAPTDDSPPPPPPPVLGGGPRLGPYGLWWEY